MHNLHLPSETIAVQSAPELEVTGQKRAGLFQNLDDFLFCHVEKFLCYLKKTTTFFIFKSRTFSSAASLQKQTPALEPPGLESRPELPAPGGANRPPCP